VRAAWEKEGHFPQQIVNGLRPYFMEAGLHFFKHRKRVLYVSATKPVRHPAGQVFSDGITAILKTVEAAPRLKRPDLAAKILGEQHDAPEAAARKEQLAGDLHYLIHAGHVIEFSNGILELPLAPQEKPAGDRPSKPPSSESAVEAADESSIVEAGEAEPEASVETAPESSSEAEVSATADAIATEPVVPQSPVQETNSVDTAPTETAAEEPPPAFVSTTQSPPPAPEDPSDPSLAH